MSSVTELFNSIKMDPNSVFEMYNLCNEFINGKGTESETELQRFRNYLEMKVKLCQTKLPNIDKLKVSNFKYIERNCATCDENEYEIKCFINNIDTKIIIKWNNKYKLNEYYINLALICSDGNESTYQTNKVNKFIVVYCNNFTDGICQFKQLDDIWVSEELSKTDNTIGEFTFLLSALCMF